MQDDVGKYKSYEEYLDSLLKAEDKIYMDQEMGRMIAELGYRSSGETLTREKFAQIREQIQMDKRMREKKNEKTEIQDGGEEEDPIVQSVRERYASNKEGTLNTILYLQIETEKGAVVSGHIDIRERIAQENFLPYLTGEKTLTPQSEDLTYANLSRGKGKFTSTPQWQVISENRTLAFKSSNGLDLVYAIPNISRYSLYLVMGWTWSMLYLIYPGERKRRS
ncbi:uncharacterized protein C4orf22 homolog isoform X2 [Eurytemora carolleeae]|uniref:uncharacterized protein C4orf22 homolog isoform X2 n=1 Tax=Eurytemora carolleeae TaxID=1294199 RepID=UPI000C772522|nr:uncharacterized protein C4orf22 homolog isoform X2 [Eurytemora carolleeae]|eukprot:XP_023341799.1 uncharacterized protein C4orf22 homolog isoform X2 [Eurytemora affinis]